MLVQIFGFSRSFLFFLFKFFHFLLVCFLFSDGCLIGSMGVVCLVDGEDGVTADMIRSESDSENYELPQPAVSLEYECEISPESFSCTRGVKFPCNLWFSTYVK